MSRRQTAGTRARPGDRKREERAARRAQAKERRNQEPGEHRGLIGQLRTQGLRIREVPGDGNCLFRALGDQLEGHSRNHLKHRQETVDYMIKQRQDFEPFVEDDVPFDKHVVNLAKPGTFAGNDAIVAFARNHQLLVVIHQLNNPLWQIRGTDKADAQELHIVYRYGEHYDSVRRLNDNSETPANLRTQMLCKDGANWTERNQLVSPVDEAEDCVEDFQQELDEAVHKVRNATGCSDVNLILQNLEAESYDIESAVIAILQTEELNRADPKDETALQEAPQQSPLNRALCEDRSSGSSDIGNHVNTHSKAENRIRKHKSQNQPDGSEKPTGSRINQVTESAADRNRPQKQASNKQRKEQQRQEKKRRQEERHRQKVLENRSNNVDNNRNQAPNEEPVTLVQAFTALTI